MPEIGNPNTNKNPFKNISKYKGPDRGRPVNPNTVRKSNRSVGETLNEIAGARQEKQFVDRDKHNKMDKNAFLKLLSAQLANQDPLKPVDQKKFAADMAQFAQLEQLTNMNGKLDKTTANNKQQIKFMGASFIGKIIHTAGASISYDGKQRNVNLPFYLAKPAKNIIVKVFDKSNNLIAQIDKESMGSGANSVTWDGVQLDNIRATKGDYHFSVMAFDEKYQPFNGETRAKGVVTGVAFENGETILMVDGKRKVALRDVDSFHSPKKEHSAAKSPQIGKSVNAAYNNSKDQLH